MTYDVGLIRLSSPMEFNSCVGTVCMPSEAVSPGGSSPTKLQEAKVTVLSNKACKQTGYGNSEIHSSMICAQGTNSQGDTTDACQGDSGGPLVCNSQGVWTVHGATSWGYGCAQQNYPGIWARVTSTMDWIEETMIANMA